MIEVYSGAATVASCPKGVEVEIRDYDEMEDGSPDESPSVDVYEGPISEVTLQTKVESDVPDADA